MLGILKGSVGGTRETGGLGFRGPPRDPLGTIGGTWFRV